MPGLSGDGSTRSSQAGEKRKGPPRQVASGGAQRRSLRDELSSSIAASARTHRFGLPPGGVPAARTAWPSARPRDSSAGREATSAGLGDDAGPASDDDTGAVRGELDGPLAAPGFENTARMARLSRSSAGWRCPPRRFHRYRLTSMPTKPPPYAITAPGPIGLAATTSMPPTSETQISPAVTKYPKIQAAVSLTAWPRRRHVLQERTNTSGTISHTVARRLPSLYPLLQA